MKINEDLVIPSLNKSILEGIVDSIEIEEIGSNSNGSYIKFKNGIMICYGRRTFTCTNSGAVGSLWYDSNRLSFGNFPVAFIEKPFCITQSEGNMCLVEYTGLSATSPGGGYVMNATKRTNQTQVITFLAIGKWK